MSGLLTPGGHRAGGIADDALVLSTLIRVEVAWTMSLARVGVVSANGAEQVRRSAAELRPDFIALAEAAEAAGNPVVPLVELLRDASGSPDAVHRGLTSQDVLDTALVLLARDGLVRMSEELEAIARSLATLADQHRRSVAAGRTLGQWAVPISFGLKAAQWLIGVLDARDDITRVVSSLPVQCGGAAGTRALADQLSAGHADALAHAFADELQLTSPALPWHTRRRPLTSVGDAVVGTTDALGVVAADIVLLSRPEIAEVRECPVPGRGGSSTMPHKQNPVLSVLVCAAAQQAPLLAAQLHLAAATAVDERPPGAWHAEWPALARLLELGVTAASQGSELVAGLQVDGEAMAARARAAADQLLAERGGGDDPAEYLGRSEGFVDAALARFNDTAGMVTGRA